MRSNKYAGVCACGRRVPAGAGEAVKLGGAWQVRCAECVAREGSRRGELRAEGVIYAAYDRDALPLLRAMPGARWVPEYSAWRVSVQDGDLERTLELARKLGLQIAPELETREAELLAAQRALETRGLYPFQARGVVWLRNRERALLADDMGLGKTVQALLALPEAEACRAVVVCPASLKHNWAAECERWRPDLRAEVLAGRGSFRLPAHGQVVILNYDILPVEEEIEALGDSLQNACVIVDEASLARKASAQRTRRVRALTDRAGRTWLLTGTPLENRPLDLWGVLRSGGLERAVFGGWQKFVELYHGRKNRWGGWDFGRPEPEAAERLRRVMLRRRKDEVLRQLPPITYRVIEVDLESGDLLRELDTLWELWGELEPERQSLPRFSQMARVREQLARARVGALLELVEEYEAAEEPVVVFSAHRAPIDALVGREAWAVITGDTTAEQRAEVVRRFQAGELRGVGLTIQAGGYGLTLTRASHAIFVDLDWRPALNRQAEDRVRRIGQQAGAILVTRLVSRHPLDLHVLRLLDAKQRLIDAAVEASVRYDAPDEEQLRQRVEAATRAAEELERAEAAELLVRHESTWKEEPEVTDAVAARVRAAWDAMRARCDGAYARDGQGFNKADAYLAHRLLPVLDDPRAVRLARAVLRRYRAQLAELGMTDVIE